MPETGVNHIQEVVSMKKRSAVIGLVSILAIADLAAAKDDCYYVLENGRKEKCDSIEVVNSAGDIKIDGKVTLKRGKQYRLAMVPKPKEVLALEKAYEGGKYDIAVKAGPKVMDMYKFLGWGDYIGYLEGMSRLELKQFSQALDVFKAAMQFSARYGDELTRGIVLAMLELKQTDQVKPLLEKMMKAPKPADAAFAFNVRGRMLSDEGKKKEAVLEYLKTLLLLDPDDVEQARNQAREQAVALLKEMNDPNWKRIEELK